MVDTQAIYYTYQDSDIITSDCGILLFLDYIKVFKCNYLYYMQYCIEQYKEQYAKHNNLCLAILIL